MKCLSRVTIVFLLIILVILVTSLNSVTRAAISIEPPLGKSPKIQVKVVEEDDESDTDQSFDAQHRYVVQVTNGARRFLGVYIDRLYPPNPVMEIDNGLNDILLNPAEAALTFDHLHTYLSALFGYGEDYTNKSRAYIIPVPDDLEPGKEVKFRLKLLGLSMYNQLPFDLTEDNSPPEANRLIISSANSLFSVLLGPMTRTITSLAAPANEDLAKGLINDMIGHTENLTKWFNMVMQGDFQGLLADYCKFIAASETSINLLKAHGAGEDVADQVLNSIGLIVENWNTISDAADVPYVVTDLTLSDWKDEYTVHIVAPQITAIVPDDGVAGAIVAIEGKGFDPNVPSHNIVYFSRLNQFGTTIPASLKGEVISTDEFPATSERIYARIPEGFAMGPVEVQVDMLTSNQVTFADDFKAILAIVSPSQNANLNEDAYTIEAEISNPPDSFPASAAIASYFVDGELKLERQIDTEDFTFTLDTGSLDFGSHTARIELQISGRVIADELKFNKVIDLSAYNLAHISVRFDRTYHNTLEGDSSVDWDLNFGGSEDYHHGAFQGTVYSTSWNEVINEEIRTGSISLTLSSERDEVTSFSFEWGSTWNDTATTRKFQGQNLSLTGSGSTWLEFSASGSDVCTNNLTEAVDSVVDTGSAPYTKQITSWSCNESSYVRIKLYKD